MFDGRSSVVGQFFDRAVRLSADMEVITARVSAFRLKLHQYILSIQHSSAFWVAHFEFVHRAKIGERLETALLFFKSRNTQDNLPFKTNLMHDFMVEKLQNVGKP